MSTFTAFAKGSLATKSWHPLAVNVAEAIPGWVAGAAARAVPSEMGEPVAWANVPWLGFWFTRIVTELSTSLTAAKSKEPLFRKSAATSATGPTPAGSEVLGNGLLAPPGFGVKVEVPRLPESKESVMGNRWPTKKVAGFPSCDRKRTCRPLCTSESASEKSAAAAGRV